MEEAQKIKEKIEDSQRYDRKLRQKYEDVNKKK